MRLSFDDEESFKEAVESLRFNNPPSDQHIGSRNSMPLENSERNEDNISPSDSITLRRVGSSSSIRETRRSGDIQVFLNNPQIHQHRHFGSCVKKINISLLEEVYGGLR